MEKRLIVYAATLTGSGKSYVGLTGQPLEIRRRQHLSAANCGKKSAFYSAIRKHGASAFEWTELAECIDREALNACEAFFIRQLDSRRRGYNMTDGADGVLGYMHASKTKSTIGEAAKLVFCKQPRRQYSLGFNWRIGRTLSAEHRAKIGAGLQGHRNALKLHEDAVPSILERIAVGESQTKIAKSLGVDRVTVGNAIKRYRMKEAAA